MMLVALVNLPSGDEMVKGIASYAIPFTWFLITAFWPFWVIVIIIGIIRRLPDILEWWRSMKK